MSAQAAPSQITVHSPEEKKEKKKRKQKNKEHTVPQVASAAPSCPAAAAAQAAVAFLKQREEERKRAEEALEAERATVGQKGTAVHEAPRQTSASESSKKKKKNKSAKPGPLTERDRQYRTFLEESGQILGDSPDKNRARTQSELYGKKKKNPQKSRQASSPSQAEAPASPTNSEGDSRSVRSHSWELVDLPSPEGTGVVVTPVHTSSTPSPVRAMPSQGGTGKGDAFGGR